MRRVLFCTQTANVWGGFETWMDQITRALPAAGWDCTVALASGRHHDAAAYREAHPHMRTVELDGRGGTHAWRRGAIRELLERQSPDVVVPVNLYEVLLEVARAKSEGREIRALLPLQGFVPAAVEDLRELAPWVDMVVSVNRLLDRIAGRHCQVPAGRRRVIANGSPEPPDSGPREPHRGPLRLAYVGRLDDVEKRVRDIPGLVRALDERGVAYEFGVVGDGPCRRELEAALAGAIAAGRVTFHGRRRQAELYASFYPALDGLLLFSPAEGSPLVLGEGMLHGLVPVVSLYRGCAADDLVREGETGFRFPVGDVAAAADRLLVLDRDRPLLARLGEAARREARLRLSETRCMETWVAAFDQTVAAPALTGGSPPHTQARPSGRLERLGLGPGLAHRVRRAAGRSPAVRDAGAEWPHCGGHRREELERLELLAGELDSPRVEELPA